MPEIEYYARLICLNSIDCMIGASLTSVLVLLSWKPPWFRSAALTLALFAGLLACRLTICNIPANADDDIFLNLANRVGVDEENPREPAVDQAQPLPVEGSADSAEGSTRPSTNYSDYSLDP